MTLNPNLKPNLYEISWNSNFSQTDLLKSQMNLDFLGYFRPTNEYNIVDIKPTPNANIFEFNNCMQCWKGGNHQIRTYVAQIYVISYKNHGQNYYRPL